MRLKKSCHSNQYFLNLYQYDQLNSLEEMQHNKLLLLQNMNCDSISKQAVSNPQDKFFDKEN